MHHFWNSLHHGRPKTVENKGSSIRYNKINITFSDWVIVENIISGNVIITFLGMIFSTITQSGNVIFIKYSFPICFCQRETFSFKIFKKIDKFEIDF